MPDMGGREGGRGDWRRRGAGAGRKRKPARLFRLAWSALSPRGLGSCCLQYLEEEYRKGAREDDPMPPVQPYHYGSHYSNSGTVLHFLVRMPPFTKMFLAYQGKRLF